MSLFNFLKSDAAFHSSMAPEFPSSAKTPVMSALVSDAAFHSSMAPTNEKIVLADNSIRSDKSYGTVSPVVKGVLSNNSASWSAPSTPQQLQYIDAPYAEKYGMSAETAYQEALSNSAYQRKVADLKKAGLNPVLGISGSGASSFYGESASSGGYGSSGSGKSSKSFDLSSLPYAVGAAATLATLSAGKGPYKAQAAGSLMQNFVSLFTRNVG